jgi:hypothetical protein
LFTISPVLCNAIGCADKLRARLSAGIVWYLAQSVREEPLKLPGADYNVTRFTLRRANVAKETRLYGGGRVGARAGHRRQYGDLQLGE